MGLAADTDLLTFSNGTLTIGGTLAATTLTGAGSGITGLNASNLGSGTIPDARFPATLPAISGANLTNLPASGATLSGSTDNTVVTVTGANAMQGEATLTFGSNALSFDNDHAGNNAINLINDENNASASTRLTIQTGHANAGDAVALFHAGGDSYIIGVDNDDSNKFKIAATGGNLGTNDRFIMNTTGVEAIKFSPTQVASADVNTLDDYEEGSWTPILYDNSRSSESQSGDQVVGRYTKIGNQVFITGHYRSSSLGSLTTTEGAYIGGLPFTSANINTHYHSLTVSNYGGFDNLSAGHGVYASIYENNDFLSLIHI